ncbi:conserved Plasmodium protein, unknown function [Plasmodium gallinaceum]|uniref:Dynein regulatory complex subunit 7 MORN domain-containing protein n=1 Tax=Plasmodium gallinaceum TaxID=5849 RepID=A0A1J1GXH1_PLAGA|nr:conserved Plasmodium protein, unknown function [Plasmodium gallinaceum]CRG96936.1 conserved Plasmodium protein, unknown function [Plasmodium gallinaceum]
MKNKNKLKRCLDYLKSNKEAIIQNYSNILPSDKEKIILNYLKTLKIKLREKYNIEFCEFFIDEYGNKRNLCSSIIQIFFPFDKGNNYKEIYSLIKNYFTYEILLKKKIKTLLLPDVSRVFDWKIADCADLSTIVVSSLRTKNYEAYVVCGEAPFYICSKNDKKLFCDFNLKEFKQSKEKNEYIPEIKEKKRKYEKVLNINKSQLRNIKFEEKKIISDNDFYVHMWILIKKSLDLKKDIFIEMSSGREYNIDNCPYKSIFYLWNEKNIYININKTENMNTLISEIKNKEYFVPAFYEEFKNKKTLNPIIENKFYKIRKDRFLLKYPHGCNTTFYENCKKDEYGDFLQHDGLIEMHTHYENKYYTSIDYTCSFYKYRRDKKIAKIYLPQKFKIIEYYDDYSHQFLKKLEQIIGFYSYFKFYSNRSDGLIYYFEIKSYKLMEYYVNRNDNIIYRSVKLSDNIKTIYKLQSFEGNEYYVTKITVKYKNKNMKNAIYKKVFLIPENKIIVIFYNNNNKISNICEVYEKFTKFNAEKEENEEILIYRKNLIYKHFINYADSVESDILYLLKEERDFFEDIMYTYKNVICSIMKEKKEIKRLEDDYQYMSNSITNINEIIYHDNNKIHFLNKSLLDDNLNIYKFYQSYPWNNYSEVSMKNTFFSSKKSMLKTENARNEIAYVASEKKNKVNLKDTNEEVNKKIKFFFYIFHFNIYVYFII